MTIGRPVWVCVLERHQMIDGLFEQPLMPSRIDSYRFGPGVHIQMRLPEVPCTRLAHYRQTKNFSEQNRQLPVFFV